MEIRRPFRNILENLQKSMDLQEPLRACSIPLRRVRSAGGYIAAFLNTTQKAPIREPYLELDRLLQGKDFHILTTNQDTQFVKLYPEEKVSEIQGDHRFFQCSRCCEDDTWDAVKPVEEMIRAMGEGTFVPTELIPRCPHCGAEAFPWVRGYGNFLQGKKYDREYQKISEYIQKNRDKKVLFPGAWVWGA